MSSSFSASAMGILIGAKVDEFSESLIYERSGMVFPSNQVLPDEDIPPGVEDYVAKIDIAESELGENLKVTLIEPNERSFYLCQYDII